MIPAAMGSPPTNGNGLRQQAVGQNKNHSEVILHGQSAAVNQLPFPDPETVKGRCLGAMLRGERITHLDCWKRFGSARLSHHAYILRGTGWPVEMVEQTVTTSDAGRPASIGIYFLNPNTIAAAGDAGREYADECARVEVERRAT